MAEQKKKTGKQGRHKTVQYTTPPT